MAVLDKITKAAQDVVRGAKDFTDTARQNSLIADEEKQITQLYMQIGKLYHETQEADPDAPLGKLCLAVNASYERIAAYYEEIRKIKGTTRCPSCSASIPINSSFCGVCGTRILAANNVQPPTNPVMGSCMSCSAELDVGVAFCTACGLKQ